MSYGRNEKDVLEPHIETETWLIKNMRPCLNSKPDVHKPYLNQEGLKPKTPPPQHFRDPTKAYEL